MFILINQKGSQINAMIRIYFHLTLRMALLSRCYNYPHVRDEKAGALEGGSETLI